MESTTSSLSAAPIIEIMPPSEALFRSGSHREIINVQRFFETSRWNEYPAFWHQTYNQLTTMQYAESMWRPIDECRLRAGIPCPSPQKQLVEKFTYLDPFKAHLAALFGSGPSKLWEDEVSTWATGKPPRAFLCMLEHLAGCTKALKVPSCMMVDQIAKIIEVAELAQRVQNDYFLHECGQKLSILLHQMGDDLQIESPIHPNCVRDFFQTCPEMLERILALNLPECAAQLLMLRDPIDVDAVLTAMRAGPHFKTQEKLMDDWFAAQLAPLKEIAVLLQFLGHTNNEQVLLYTIHRHNGEHGDFVKALTRHIIKEQLRNPNRKTAINLLRLAVVCPIVKKIIDRHQQPLTNEVSCSFVWSLHLGDRLLTKNLSHTSAKILADIVAHPWMTSLHPNTPERLAECLKVIKQQSLHFQVEISRTLPYLITAENLVNIVRVMRTHPIELKFGLESMLLDAAIARWPGLSYDAIEEKCTVGPNTVVDDALWEVLSFVKRRIHIPTAEHAKAMLLWAKENDHSVALNYLWSIVPDINRSAIHISMACKKLPRVDVAIERPIPDDVLKPLTQATQVMVQLGWTLNWKG